MKQLTDLEICKRIAEIEGVDVLKGDGEHRGKIYHIWQNSERYGILLQHEYNPLTDGALCFRLMVKHKVNTSFNGDYTEATTGEFNILSSRYKVNVMDESPNKAICLAIIEAHNEN